jgi:hypothetical protein
MNGRRNFTKLLTILRRLIKIGKLLEGKKEFLKFASLVAPRQDISKTSKTEVRPD